MRLHVYCVLVCVLVCATLQQDAPRQKRTLDFLLKTLADTLGYDVQKRPSVLPIGPPPGPMIGAPKVPATGAPAAPKVPAVPPKPTAGNPAVPPGPMVGTPKVPAMPPAPAKPPPRPAPSKVPPPTAPPLLTETIQKRFNINFNWNRGVAPALPPPPPAGNPRPGPPGGSPPAKGPPVAGPPPPPPPPTKGPPLPPPSQGPPPPPPKTPPATPSNVPPPPTKSAPPPPPASKKPPAKSPPKKYQDAYEDYNEQTPYENLQDYDYGVRNEDIPRNEEYGTRNVENDNRERYYYPREEEIGQNIQEENESGERREELKDENRDFDATIATFWQNSPWNKGNFARTSGPNNNAENIRPTQQNSGNQFYYEMDHTNGKPVSSHSKVYINQNFGNRIPTSDHYEINNAAENPEGNGHQGYQSSSSALVENYQPGLPLSLHGVHEDKVLIAWPSPFELAGSENQEKKTAPQNGVKLSRSDDDYSEFNYQPDHYTADYNLYTVPPPVEYRHPDPPSQEDEELSQNARVSETQYGKKFTSVAVNSNTRHH